MELKAGSPAQAASSQERTFKEIAVPAGIDVLCRQEALQEKKLLFQHL